MTDRGPSPTQIDDTPERRAHLARVAANLNASIETIPHRPEPPLFAYGQWHVHNGRRWVLAPPGFKPPKEQSQ